MSAFGSYRVAFGYAMLSVLLVSFSQLALRFAMLQIPGDGSLQSYLDVSSNDNALLIAVMLGAGIAGYGSSFLVWLVALRQLPLSVAYPMLSLSYPLVYLVAVTVPAFGEFADPLRTFGIALIVVGVSLVAFRDRKREGQRD